jgi:hypothetical protein
MPRPIRTGGEQGAAGSFTCPCCGIVSHHPMDVEQGYCGLCHWWTGDPALGPPHLEAECEARRSRTPDRR